MEHRRPSAEPQKKSGKEKAKKEVQGDGDEEGEEVAPGERIGEDKRRRPCSSAASKRGSGGGGGGGSGGASPPCCQAEKCTADLAEAKRYYRRHKVCEAHSKAAVVIVAGLRQRFCQQCSRLPLFHPLPLLPYMLVSKVTMIRRINLRNMKRIAFMIHDHSSGSGGQV